MDLHGRFGQNNPALDVGQAEDTRHVLTGLGLLAHQGDALQPAGPVAVLVPGRPAPHAAGVQGRRAGQEGTLAQEPEPVWLHHSLLLR